jgi:hypothetical protein
MVVVDDAEPLVRQIQVVAGNRSLNGSAQAFRIEAVPVEGLAEPITIAVPLGESEKSVEDLLGAKTDGTAQVSSELIQATIAAALETGEKTRAYIDEVCKDELDINPDPVFRRGLAPLKKRGRICARKDGLTGGWYWSLKEGGA